MNTRFFLMAGAALMVSAGAQAATVTTTKTTTTTAPVANGAVVYESKTVTAPAVPHGVRPVIFYYYDAKAGEIIAGDTMTEEIFKIWDRDGNGHISPQEYYNNEMVLYEPVETQTQVFADVDADGRMELAREEYTLRLQQSSAYATLNKDDKAGISAHEFVGAGFQVTDDNDDNQVSYGEFVEAFYGQPRLASEQERYNN